MTHRERKQAIRVFLQADYNDERLAWLLAHARAGKLAYQSCCCLIGLRTANHPLEGKNDQWAHGYPGHDNPHTALSGYAGSAYCGLAMGLDWKNFDAKRRRILIPMVLAEMRRRERAKAPCESAEDTAKVTA